MESGPKYAICKEGLLKLVVLVFACTAFSLLAASGAYTAPEEKTWAFAAFIISFAISFLFYIFHVIGRMDCSGSCSYMGFEFLWSWICTIHFFAASIALAINVNCTAGNKYCDLQIASVCIAFVTVVLYAVESYFLRSYAPANVGYIATPSGWLKTLILVFGGAAFSLLVDSGYSWCRYNGCKEGITYALVAYCIAWSVTLLLFFAMMFVPNKMSSKQFKTFQFAWSAFCVLLFITASSCFAAYMECSNFDWSYCRKRLAGVISGFITAVLYAVDAVMNRPKH